MLLILCHARSAFRRLVVDGTFYILGKNGSLINFKVQVLVMNSAWIVSETRTPELQRICL